MKIKNLDGQCREKSTRFPEIKSKRSAEIALGLLPVFQTSLDLLKYKVSHSQIGYWPGLNILRLKNCKFMINKQAIS